MNRTLLREYDIMLNPVLGAYALAFFIRGFISKSNELENKVTLWHIVTVLPLVFNKVSRYTIIKRRGGLRSILNRDPKNNIAQNEVIFNLNNRIQIMSHRTFRSLNYAISYKLIKLEDGYFYPEAKIKIPTNTGEDTKEILKASEKLGAWAGELNVFEYLTVLGVRP